MRCCVMCARAGHPVGVMYIAINTDFRPPSPPPPYIFTFNYYVALSGGGGGGLFVLFGSLVFSLWEPESLHICTVYSCRCEHARFCVEILYALYKTFHSFIQTLCVLKEETNAVFGCGQQCSKQKQQLPSEASFVLQIVPSFQVRSERLFKAQLSPKRYWRRSRSLEGREGGTIHNAALSSPEWFRVKMDSDEGQFNLVVSLFLLTLCIVSQRSRNWRVLLHIMCKRFTTCRRVP